MQAKHKTHSDDKNKSSCCGGHHKHDTVEELKNLAHEAGREARHMLDEVGEKAPEVASKLEKNIKENPVQSSLIALGLGFLAGSFFRRD